MKRILGLVLGITLAFASTSPADVIFDNGAPDFTTGLFSDPGYPQFIVDNFTLDAGSNTITDIHWWGGYAFDNLAPVDNFTISIYEQVGTNPADSALLDIAVGAATRVDSGFDLGSFDIYEYSVDVSPITLAANTTYYLSIVNDTALSTDNWYWSTSGTGSSEDLFFRTSPSDSWLLDGSGIGYEMAFNLTNDNQQQPVPEPATLSLLGMGIAGLAFRRRKQQA